MDELNAAAGAEVTECPSADYTEAKRDQLVAEFAHCSIQEAKQLPAPEYNFYLRCKTAELEALPGLEEARREQMDRRREEDEMRREAM